MHKFSQNPEDTSLLDLLCSNQEHKSSIMVSALKHVITSGENNVGTTYSGLATPYSLVETVMEQNLMIPVPDTATCESCKIDGCLGCNLFETNTSTSTKCI